MSHTQRMMEFAKCSRAFLAAAGEDVSRFVESCRTPDGGFRGRGEASDLYYAMFGLESLLALGRSSEAIGMESYLRSFGAGESLDFMHLTCLARSWSWYPVDQWGERDRQALSANLETYRSKDGGYHTTRGSERASLYGCFLANNAYADMDLQMPKRNGLVRSLMKLRSGDAGFGNEGDMKSGTTTAVVGAVLLMTDFGRKVEPALVEWLMARQAPEGGFVSSPDVTQPDLVSTATAVYALRVAGAPVDGIRESCMGYVETLWHESGGFCGHWMDELPDCEHTFYGLLTIGGLM